MAQKRRKGKSSGGSGGGGGGILGMRQGFRKLVGVDKGAAKAKAKPNPVWNVVSWMVVAALVVVTGFVLYRRFGG